MTEKNTVKSLKDFMVVHLPRDEFAKKIGLGLPMSSLALIEGEEGSGRSIVSQRLAYGLLENGFTVTYLSSEMTLKDFINQMYSMKYNVGPHLITTRLKFIPVLPIIGESTPREGYLDVLMSNPDIFSSQVTIIDSMSDMIDDSHGEKEINDLLEYLKKTVYGDKVVIMTIKKGQRVMDRIRQSVDVFFELELRSSSYGLRHLLKVRRYLKAKSKVDKMVEFRVEPDVGLIIEITEVSG